MEKRLWKVFKVEALPNPQALLRLIGCTPLSPILAWQLTRLLIECRSTKIILSFIAISTTFASLT